MKNNQKKAVEIMNLRKSVSKNSSDKVFKEDLENFQSRKNLMNVKIYKIE